MSTGCQTARPLLDELELLEELDELELLDELEPPEELDELELLDDELDEPDPELEELDPDELDELDDPDDELELLPDDEDEDELGRPLLDDDAAVEELWDELLELSPSAKIELELVVGSVIPAHPTAMAAAGALTSNSRKLRRSDNTRCSDVPWPVSFGRCSSLIAMPLHENTIRCAQSRGRR